MGRSITYEVQPLSDDLMRELLHDVLAKEGKEGFPEQAVNKITEGAKGCPRDALILLGQVIEIPNKNNIMAFLGVKPEAEPPEGMERAEPCRLFIQQEIYRGIESGEKPAPASRKISAWLEEHLHLLINARSIEQAFRRRQARLHQQKSATKVAKPKPKATERNWLQEAQEYREKIMERRRTESVERLITEIDMRVAECKACMLCSAPISPNWKLPKKI